MTFEGIPTPPGLLMDILRLALWLAVLAALFVPLERAFAVHPRDLLRRGGVTDLGYYFVSGLTSSSLLSLPIAGLAWSARAVVPAAIPTAAASLPLWARLVSGMVAGEFGYYWGHRLSHEIPFLWRFHAIHHGAEEVDFLVNTRAHPVDLIFGRLCGLAPIYILGLGGPVGAEGSAVPVLVALVGTLWGFFIHANLRWRFGPLEWIVSTPAFHHWHHVKSGPINRNYASTLPWIDVLFGTCHLPGDAFPADYGIKAELPETLPEQLLFPFLPGKPPASTPDRPEVDLAASEGS